MTRAKERKTAILYSAPLIDAQKYYDLFIKCHLQLRNSGGKKNGMFTNTLECLFTFVFIFRRILVFRCAFDMSLKYNIDQIRSFHASYAVEMMSIDK